MALNDRQTSGTAVKPRSDARDSTRDEIVSAAGSGDVDRLHELYSTWLAKQKPYPADGVIIQPYNWPAAEAAASNGHWPCLNYLLSLGLRLNGNIIHVAVESRSLEVMEGMLTKGWKINMPQGYYDPPYMAVHIKDEAMVRWFLGHGADPNAPAEMDDITCLSKAVYYAPLSIIDLLFEHGGSVARGNLIWSAAQRKDDDALAVLQTLVDRGAATNEWLFESKPEHHLWSVAQGGQTPLYMAAQAGLVENVKFLLKYGADPNKQGPRATLKDHEEPTWIPIDVARHHKHEEVVQILEEASKALMPESKKTGFWAALGWK